MWLRADFVLLLDLLHSPVNANLESCTELTECSDYLLSLLKQRFQDASSGAKTNMLYWPVLDFICISCLHVWEIEVNDCTNWEGSLNWGLVAYLCLLLLITLTDTMMPSRLDGDDKGCFEGSICCDFWELCHNLRARILQSYVYECIVCTQSKVQEWLYLRSSGTYWLLWLVLKSESKSTHFWFESCIMIIVEQRLHNSKLIHTWAEWKVNQKCQACNYRS